MEKKKFLDRPHNGKRASIIIFIVALILLFVCCIFIFLNGKVNTDNKFVVMSTTDMHGKVWEKALDTGKPEPNNMLAASTVANNTRNEFGEKSILWDNGDLYQGSLVSTIDIPQGNNIYESTINPTALCMKEMKYDGYNPGNHEFNYPVSTMEGFYNYLEENGINQYCANIYYPGNNERVRRPYKIKTINVDGKEVKVAIIGIENTDIPRWDNAGNYKSWQFHSQENPNGDVSYEIKKAQEEMAKNGDKPDFTIVSYHGGFFAEGASNGLENKDFDAALEEQMKQPVELYKNSESQGYRAVRNSSGVDMFILGHDHSDKYSNRQYKNADGKDVLVVNAAKKYITKSVFTVEKDKEGKMQIKLAESKNVDLSKFDPDADLRNKIKPYADQVEKKMNEKIATFKGDWNFRYGSNDYFTKQTDIVDLINRAQIAYGTLFLQRKFKDIDSMNQYIDYMSYTPGYHHFDKGDNIECDLAVSSGATNFTPNNDKVFTIAEAATLYPYDNQINIIPIKGEQIKDLLEYNASNRYKLVDDGNGNKHVETINDRYTLTIPYGLNFYYDMSKPEGSRVNISGFSNGKAFNPKKTYCMVINSYLMGNKSNPVLDKLSSYCTFQDETTDGPADLCRDIIVTYAKTWELNYGGIYPTNEADKDKESVCHWEMKY